MPGERIRGRVLVLGAAGYIGGELTRYFLSRGASVTCFDRAMPDGARVSSGSVAEPRWVTGDFSDRERLEEALSGADYVVHLISTTIPDTSNKDLPGDLMSNVIPTLNLLDALKAMPIRKFVFVSSGGTVYGIPRTVPIAESHDTDPVCGYGIHKLAIEKYLHWYNYNHGLDYCILRLANPYSPSQISDRPQGAIGRFVYKALRNEPLDIIGDGTAIRDYIYMEDVLDVFSRTLAYSGDKRVFNVGSGVGHSLLDIVGIIEAAVGRPLDLRFSAARSSDVPLNILDISRIRSEFGWEPTTDLVSGIQKMVDFGRGRGR